MKDTKTYIFYLHIFVLVAFALAQPLYDLIGQYPTFLVAHDVQPAQLLLFVVLISFGIPLAFVVVQFIVGIISEAWRLRIQLVLVFIFSTLIFLPVLKKVIPGSLVFVFALLASGLLTYGYYRIRSVRTIFTYLTPVILVFPAIFLFTGSVANVLFPGKGQAAEGVAIRSTPPIVYIIFDEFTSVSLMDENHNVDVDRFPNFAAFARDAYWCRNATTNAPVTRFAVPALLTGVFPPGDREMLPVLKNYPRNLFTLLHEHYAYNINEPLTELCPDSKKEQPEDISYNSFLKDVGLVYVHVISPSGFSKRLPSVSRNWTGFLDQEDESDYENELFSRRESMGSTMEDWRGKLKVGMNKPKKREDFRQFVASIATQPRPSFNFYHCLLPHRPHTYLPSAGKYDASKFRLNVNEHRKWVNDTMRTGLAYQRYVLQVQFVDTLVGELIRKMKNSGLYDQALIILTSDHGVNYEPGEFRRDLTEDTCGEVLPVPLFIKLPNQKKGIVDDRNIESVDVVATIVDYLGVEPNWALDGMSILDQSTTRRPKKSAYMGKLGVRYYDPRFEEKYDALDRKLDQFGTGKDPWALFRNGPHGDLVGKKLQEVTTVNVSGMRVRVPNARALVNVRPNSFRAPVIVAGEVVDMKMPHNEWPLAISLNGVIAAVTRSYVLEKNGRIEQFECLIPESTLLEGNNELGVFVIGQDPDGKRRLERLEIR